MSPHKDEGHETSVDSQTSKELSQKASDDSQTSSESSQEVSILNSNREQFALRCRFRASEKKLYHVNRHFSRKWSRDLETIRRRYEIPISVKMFAPKKGETADNPPEGFFAVYDMMFENGLRLPANDFVNEVLAAVGRAPAQIIPNSWIILTAFQVACHDAGVRTSVELFKKMYRKSSSSCKLFKNINRENYFAQDYIYFSHNINRNLTLLNLPSRHEREPYFFFVSSNAFSEKVPSRFCFKTVPFICKQSDIEVQYLKLSKKFTRRLPYYAYLDEKVLRRCNIYKDAHKRPMEDAHDLQLKKNDALGQRAINRPSSTAEISRRPLEVTSNGASNPPIDTSVIRSADSQSDGSAVPVVSSSSLKTEKVSTLDANGDENDEIIDQDKVLFSKKNSSSNMTPTVCSSLPSSAWPKISGEKRQVEHKSIAHHLKKKRPNNEQLHGEELATQLFQSPLHPEEIVTDVKEECIETDQIPIEEYMRELVKDSDLKDQDELDSVFVQLDEILEKGAQSLQETSDHRIQMTTILTSLDYCHLGASLEKAAQQVLNLRKQVDLLHSRHAKLDKCLVNYTQQVSDCKNNIEELKSVRARLETFGFKESPQEVCCLEDQVVQLISILAQLDSSVERSAQLKASMLKSEQQVSAKEDQVERLIVQNRRFDDASMEKASQESSQMQLKSLRAEFESSLNECNQLEESLKKSAQNVRDLMNEAGQLTSILAQLVVDVDQANKDFKVSSASTKILYEKVKRGEKP